MTYVEFEVRHLNYIVDREPFDARVIVSEGMIVDARYIDRGGNIVHLSTEIGKPDPTIVR
jgi:hypothetical protein